MKKVNNMYNALVFIFFDKGEKKYILVLFLFKPNWQLLGTRQQQSMILNSCGVAHTLEIEKKIKENCNFENLLILNSSICKYTYCFS